MLLWIDRWQYCFKQCNGLPPISDTEQQLNWFYQGGALDTYGLDVGYFITPAINASVGYYYQNGDLGAADGTQGE